MKAKRKLSDLKEHEYIEIKTLEHAKYVSKKLRFGTNETKVSPSYILNSPLLTISRGTFYLSVILSATYVQVNASDFIKPKKPKSKRIKKLEKKVEEIQQSLISKPSEIEVNNPETVHPLVGEWMIEKNTSSLIFVKEIITNEVPKVKGYGFNGIDENKYQNPLSIINNFRIEPVSKEEVEQALIAEAERRGYKPFDEGDTFYMDQTFNILWDRQGFGHKAIFKNGIWAEIIEEPKQEEIDWLKINRGCLVENDDVIVMCTGRTTSETFEGTVIKIKDLSNEMSINYNLGLTIKPINKIGFKILKGKITLSNE